MKDHSVFLLYVASLDLLPFFNLYLPFLGFAFLFVLVSWAEFLCRVLSAVCALTTFCVVSFCCVVLSLILLVHFCFCPVFFSQAKQEAEMVLLLPGKWTPLLASCHFV
jgi:hypothetical protein